MDTKSATNNTVKIIDMVLDSTDAYKFKFKAYSNFSNCRNVNYAIVTV